MAPTPSVASVEDIRREVCQNRPPPSAKPGPAGDPMNAHAAYFDNNATTPVDPRVAETMFPWMVGQHGNPSSAHRFGRAARQAVEKARAQVAAAIGGEPEDVVFTSSGSEANNAVMASIGESHGWQGTYLFSGLEHASIRAQATRLGKLGMRQRELLPDAGGQLQPAAVAAALEDDTRLVALMLANNELGTLQPVAEIAAVCRQRGVPILCDAVQAIGKIPVDVATLGIDYLSLGGHKFHGPLGTGALWIKKGAVMSTFIAGAGQERGLRASTENVPGIVGLGRACEIATAELASRHAKLLALRERFEQGLARIPGAIVHCADRPRLPHTTHVAFPGLVGHDLMLWLDEQGFAVSTGAACHSGKPQPSRVCLQMGLSEAESLASLRVSFGLFNELAEVDAFLAALEIGVPTLRNR